MNRSLVEGDGQEWHLGDFLCDSDGLLHESFGRVDRGHNVPLLGLLGSDGLGSQDHLQSLGVADDAGQSLGSLAAREESELDLGESELSVLACDDEVAHQGQLESTTQADTIDSSDDRLSNVVHLEPVLRKHIVEDRGFEISFGKLFDISSSGKNVLSTGKYDYMDIWVGIKFLES